MLAIKHFRFIRQAVVILVLLASGFVYAQAPDTKQVNKEDVLNGIYTSTQAARGERTYKTSCQNCHVAREYKGLIKKSENINLQISAYYDLISQTMPQDAPGSLSSDAYLNLIAYILSLNDFPATDEPKSEP